MTYNRGDAAELVLNLTTPDTGEAVDATALTLTVRAPDGTVTSRDLGEVTRVAKGEYSTSVTLDQAGDWTYRWAATAPIQVAESGELSVREDSFDAGVAPALTTVSAVREFLQKQTSDTAQDDVLRSLIARASAAIASATSRQFAPEDDVAKVFDWMPSRGINRISFEPFEARSITSVVVDTDYESPTTIGAHDFRLWPRPTPSSGTYFGIELSPIAVGIGPSNWSAIREVTITGDWGMAAVPADVEHWCIVTVAIWLRREVAAFETGLQVDEGYVERPRSLPSAVASGLELHRRMAP